jgi:prophage regulatory protein
MSTESKSLKQLITFAQLRQRVHLGRRQVDRLEMENRFPKRVPVSDRRVAWVADEIDAWIAQKIAARSTEIGTLGAGKKRAPKRAAQP